MKDKATKIIIMCMYVCMYVCNVCMYVCMLFLWYQMVKDIILLSPIMAFPDNAVIHRPVM